MNEIASKKDVLDQLIKQLRNFFTISEEEHAEIARLFDSVMRRCDINFKSPDNQHLKNRGDIQSSSFYDVYDLSLLSIK